jgi:hypothetical protein
VALLREMDPGEVGLADRQKPAERNPPRSVLFTPEGRKAGVPMEGIAAVLWQTGSALTSAVADLFMALGFETELTEYGSTSDLRVNLSDGRRLLINVVSERQGLDRKSPHIARILKVLQDEANEKDRVVLVANIGFDQALSARRTDPVSVEAARLIQGLGANFVPTSSLFGIWKASLTDASQARSSVQRLHSMDGGIFR